MREGRFVGMFIDYAGDFPSRNEELAVHFYDNFGKQIAASRTRDSRTPVDLPNPAVPRTTFYTGSSRGIAETAKNPSLGEGLTLDEVYRLWEIWNSNPGSGPPSDLAILEGTSPTADYFRARDAALADRNRQFAEWKQRRDADRESRVRTEAQQQSQRTASAQRHQEEMEQIRSRQEAARSAAAGGGTSVSQATGRGTPSNPDRTSGASIWTPKEIVDTDDYSHCAQLLSVFSKPTDDLQRFGYRNQCAFPIKIYLDTSAMLGAFGGLFELRPGQSQESWWLKSTRLGIEKIVCRAASSSGEEIYLDKNNRRCTFRKG